MHPSFSTSFRIHRIAVLSSLMIALLGSSVYALTYPGSTPPGEVTGGTYRTYFDNMFFAPCPTGQTIRGFSSSGVPNCIAGAAALSISGALGYTLYHNGTDWVSSPNIYNANGNVGIGTSTVTAKLTVSDDILVRGVNIGRGPGIPFIGLNLRFGTNALRVNTTGGMNTAIGNNALYSNLTGEWNVALGASSLVYNTAGTYNTAIGAFSLYGNTSGGYNTAVGVHSMSSNTTGYTNATFGVESLRSNTSGMYNAAFGAYALRDLTTGGYNTSIGTLSATGLTTGSYNIAIGYGAQLLSPTASNQLNIGNWIYGNGGNIGIGTNSSLTAKLTVAGQIKITGGSPGAGKVLTSDATGLATWVIPTASVVTATGVIGGTGTENYIPKFGIGGNGLYPSSIFESGGLVGIGTSTGTAKLTVAGQIKITGGSPAANKVLVSDAAGLASWQNAPTPCVPAGSGIENECYGSGALQANLTGPFNVAFGFGALTMNSNGGVNTAIGNKALRDNTTGGYNSVVGGGAMKLNQTGYFNSVLGANALGDNVTGNSNVAIGSAALRNSTNSSYNIAIGEQALWGLEYGDGNIGIGLNVSIGSGSNNIIIGNNLALASGSINQLNIGNWIYGNGGNIGIGTSSSLTTRLTVGGQIKITGGSPGLGKVLISDANGVGTWATYVSGSTATGITGGVQNYVSKFGTGGNGLYASQIFDNGTNVAIGTGTATKKLTIDSNLVNDSGLRLSRISSTSTAYTGAAMGLGVDVNGNVIPISNGDVVVYDGIDRASPPTPDPNIAGRQISYDFNNFFDIPTKQSFVVSDGSSASNNGPYFKENGSSAVCSWNGTYGSSAYNCATADPVTGLSASPHNSFTMTAKGTTFGYQIALGARGDAPLFARSGRFNGAVGGGLYTNDSPYQTPAPWQKVLTVPANHPEYLYVNTGLNSQLQSQTGGGNVGIGTTFPNSRFEVWTGATTRPLLHFRGANNVAMGLGAMNVAVSGNANSAYGAESLFSITTGYSNAAFGYRALRTNVGGYNNVSIGQESLFSNNGGSWNSAVGYQALYSNSSGTGNIAFGPQALYNLTTGNSNIAIGYQAARVIAGSSVSRNIAIGYQSLYSATTSDLVAMGHRSLYANSSGVRNTAIGYQTLDAVTTGSGNTAVGYDSLGQTTGSNNTAYGNGAGNGITSGSNNITIGSNAQVSVATGSNQLNIGNWIYGSGGYIGIGMTSPTAKLDVSADAKINGVDIGKGGSSEWGSTILGQGALRNNTSGQDNTAIGFASMSQNTTGMFNTALGTSTLSANTSGMMNVSVGYQSLRANSLGSLNVAIGYQAMNSNSTGSANIAIGSSALFWNNGEKNTAIGSTSLMFNTSGVENTANGWQSLYSNTTGVGNVGFGVRSLPMNTTGNYNTALGHMAGTGLTSGTNNIALGYNTVFPSSTASNQLNIGNWIYGNGGNIGIGTSASLTAKLTVAGTVKLGTNGSTLNNIIKVANALNVPSVAAGACTAQTTTVTNAAVGGVASVSPASALTDRMIIAYARVSAANTVEIKFCNESAASIDLASMSYYISVIQ